MPAHPPPTPPPEVHERDARSTYERKLGDSELSYFLPSRADGVNDMYLHIGLRAPAALLARPRVRAAWAVLRARHPLLAARIEMHAYDDVRFVYAAPAAPRDVLADADRALEFRTQTAHDLIDTYLNGPRTLSNTRLSYLVVAQSADTAPPTAPPTPDIVRGPAASFDSSIAPAADADVQDFDILLCAAHFLGDGMALHRCANDFFLLIASETLALDALLAQEWAAQAPRPATAVLPVALEDSLPPVAGALRRAAGLVDFQNSQAKLIGGHAFPRRTDPDGARHTLVPTVPLSAARTQRALRACKARGVSVASALFAACNVAWTRAAPHADPALPIMMYSALNLRPHLAPPPPRASASYWFLAVGYFNVILPSFFPRIAAAEAGTDAEDAEAASVDVEAARRMFWHRARAAHAQSTRAARHPLLVPRTREMARERGRRARAWARADDGVPAVAEQAPAPVPEKAHADAPTRTRAPAPSSALVGLSLLGNLDGIYAHGALAGAGLELRALTTGSRQRAGGMLLFAYTFAGRLWLSLGYDARGFASGAVERFWDALLAVVEEFLVE